jgi:excisionase family DNA binding protein
MTNMTKTAELRLDRPFYSPAEVARLVGVHPSTILNYIHEGRLSAVRLSERTYRIPARAVAKLLAPERVRPARVRERPDGRVDVDAFDRELGREHTRRAR